MIKVLHIIKSLGRGGAEMLLPETIRQHDPARFHFEVIYFLPWKDQMVALLESSGICVTCFPANNNVQIMARAGGVIRYIRQQGIQLIHCHLPWAGFLGRYIHWKTGLPVLYTEHNKQERYHRITYLLNKLSFNSQNAVIAVSANVAQSIHRNIAPKIPVIPISNGVDTAVFQRDPQRGAAVRARYGIPRDAPVVGIVAVFRFQKRLQEWLQVFAAAAQKHPELYGIIVGAGPLEEQVRATRMALGLEDKVIMPGLQINTRDWYSAMDVFMMTSSFEGMPVALLEAMSMECAVISTRAGGVGEIIEHGRSGLLVEVDAWRKLENCLEEMCNPEVRKRFAVQGRERVVSRFTVQKMVGELEKVYEDLVAPGRQPGDILTSHEPQKL